ncbi:MAG TPA: TSUP family transporter, partial [Acidimicrobiales bacterium]
MGIDLSLGEYLVVSVGVALGALAQGAVGFGANLIAVPLLAAVAPAALPGTMILLPLPLQLEMIGRERHGVVWSDVGWLTLGRVPGVLAGTWIVTAVALDQLSVLTGLVVLVAVVVSAAATRLPFTRASKLAAGAVSGTFGTATSIGGPPVALLY